MKDQLKNRILVIDNDPSTLVKVNLLFEEENYEVVGEDDRLGLLDMIKTFKPNIIMLDVIMVAVGGGDVCKEIKGLFPRLPIILMAATNGVHNVLGNTKYSDDYIDKPFDANTMLWKVHTLLNRSTMTIV